MQPRIVLIAALAGGLLVLASPALGKGPTKATLSGPGLERPLTMWLHDESGSGSSLGRLAEQAGFFQATFGQTPSAVTSKAPDGDLGPKYTLTYLVPGPDGRNDEIRQDVYPYAKPVPVTYTEPGQPFFEGDRTKGGWFGASSELRTILVAEGLASRPPVSGADESLLGSTRNVLVAGLAGALALAAAGLVIVRRRALPASAS